MNLPQVSTDLRALGQLLITQADEVDALLQGINLSALTALFGPVNGGGPVEGRPFAQTQSQSKPPKPPKPVQSKPPKVQLIPEQKAQIRDHYQRLNPKDQTLKSRHELARAYGITPMQLASIIFQSYDKARQVRLAKQQAESNTTEAEQRLNQLLKDAGATLVRARKHQVVVLKNGAKVVLSKTPSDHRATLNAVRDVRRAAREPACLTGA